MIGDSCSPDSTIDKDSKALEVLEDMIPSCKVSLLSDWMAAGLSLPKLVAMLYVLPDSSRSHELSSREVEVKGRLELTSAPEEEVMFAALC